MQAEASNYEKCSIYSKHAYCNTAFPITIFSSVVFIFFIVALSDTLLICLTKHPDIATLLLLSVCVHVYVHAPESHGDIWKPQLGQGGCSEKWANTVCHCLPVLVFQGDFPSKYLTRLALMNFQYLMRYGLPELSRPRHYLFC